MMSKQILGFLILRVFKPYSIPFKFKQRPNIFRPSLGFFGLKLSTVASGFTIPLVFLTLLFSEYCRQRFAPIFQKYPAEVLIAMDRADEMTGKMEERHNNLKAAYSQIPSCSEEPSKAGCNSPCSEQVLSDSEQLKPEKENLKAKDMWAFRTSKSGQDLEVKSCPSSSPNRYSPGFAEIYKRT